VGGRGWGLGFAYHAVLPGDSLHRGRLAGDSDEPFSGIAVLVERADVARRHLYFERDADGVLFKGDALGSRALIV
jgi:hypothetical protein